MRAIYDIIAVKVEIFLYLHSQRRKILDEDD